MSPKRAHSQLRRTIAIAAARLMATHECPDHASARIKAAKQLACHDRRQLPDNQEIESALTEYQQLFQQASQPSALRNLRQTAISAMQHLENFSPHLIGPVLTGTADQHTAVTLQLYCESVEDLLYRLMELGIPWEQTEINLQYSDNRTLKRSLISFHAGEDDIELIVLPLGDRRNPPINPLNGRPEKGAPLSRVKDLLD